MKVYVPVENINDYSCYVVYDSQTIRAYENTVQLGNNNYTDFYYQAHYMQKSGVQNISSSQELPQCLNSDYITNDYYYRLDLAHIFVICGFILLLLYFTFKVFSRLFGRWLKV